LSDESLQSLLDKLTAAPRAAFERVHRRAIVNLAFVVRLEPMVTGGYLAHTTLGDAVEVSRQSARALRKRLGLRKGEGDD
jgi:two-component system, LytTR family, response regulator